MGIVLKNVNITGGKLNNTSLPAPSCPDTNIEVNSVSEGSVVAGSTVDVQLSDSGGPVTPDSVTLVGTDLQIVLPDAVAPTPVGATLMKTGQTTSYRTGDDGDIEAGRATNFLTLASNNPFGNTNRFTDELGGQTYTNNWVIDWSTYNGATVLGYFRTPQNADTWNNAVTNSLGTFGTFSGCRLTNRKEIENLINISIANVLQYSPFTISDNLWTSSTTVFSSGNAWQLNLSSGGLIDFAGKAVLRKYIPCRTFTVNGTTLT